MQTTFRDTFSEPSPTAKKRRRLLPPSKRRRSADDNPAGNALKIRATQVLLWVLVGLAAIGGIATLIPDKEIVIPPPVITPEMLTGGGLTVEDASVGGWAELYVATWLGTGERNGSALDGYFPAPNLTLQGASAGRYYAARTTTVSVAAEEDSSITVTVAADVLRNEAEVGYTPIGIRYYQISILRTDEGLVALGLPAQVAAPPTLELPETVTGKLTQPSIEGYENFEAAMNGFVSAYLAADGPLDRFLSPETLIPAPRPAPFVSASVTSMAVVFDPEEPDNQDRRMVTAEVNAIDNDGASQHLSYAALLIKRDGRWEVSRLLPGPGLKS